MTQYHIARHKSLVISPYTYMYDYKYYLRLFISIPY